MRKKTYRSIAGYLSAIDDKLMYERAMAGGPDDIDTIRQIDARNVRRILNDLLVQLGINDRIRDDEKPGAGIERLQQTQTDERTADALRQCQRWLKNRFVSIGSKMTGVISA